MLDDPQVSRQHLELIPGNDEVCIRDCGSTHGTFLDGVALTDSAVLSYGSQARIGNVTIERLRGTNDVQSKALDSRSGKDLHLTSIQYVADLIRPEEVVAISKIHSEHTLTIVFCDIEGSTTIAVEAGDKKWYKIISSHNKLIRDITNQFGGNVVKSIGDGFMLTFLSARTAVDAFVSVQESLDSLEPSDVLKDIRIRVGIHIGEVIAADDGDYYGRHVNTAARIADKASGGEILVSNLVKEIIEVSDDIEFGAPRTESLKGIAPNYVVHPIKR